MSGLDWPALMKAGLHWLRLNPDAFWRLTPAELAVMLGMDAHSAPLGRSRLDELIRDFPDPERTKL